MSQLPILWILPLLTLTMPLAGLARDIALLPINFGQEYIGSLTPSPTNPHGEVCYKLSVKPDTRLTLNVRTSGLGIIKFAVYDSTKSLKFFHNTVSGKSKPDEKIPADSKFSFPAIRDAQQLCLTTSNTNRGQQYDLTVTAKPSRKAKSRLKLRKIASNPVTIPKSKPPVNPPTFTPPAPTPQIDLAPAILAPVVSAVPTEPIAAPISTVVLAPSGSPYCYVGTWQVTDLNGYWLPSIQNFTQAQISDPQMLGYGKVSLTKDGNATFEAIDLEQKYTLKSIATGTKIDKIGMNLAGTSYARFQSNQDGNLVFNAQDYRRLNARLHLGEGLKLSGDRLFTLFGDKDLPPANSAYKCVGQDKLILKVPLPNGQKLIPISFKRVN
jgi:hypothetical protein